MLDIRTDTDEIIEIYNGKIGLKIFKSGVAQGSYEVTYNNLKGSSSILKECYCNILLHDDESEQLIELKSTDIPYFNTVDKISTQFGNGVKIVLSPIPKDNLAISFKIQFIIYENQDFFLVRFIKIKDVSENNRRIHSISPFVIKNSKLWLRGAKSPTNLNQITWFKNGFQSWSPSTIFFGHEQDVKGPSMEILNLTYDNQDYHIEGRFYSEYITVITDLDSENSLVIGFVTNKDQFTRVVMDYEDSIDLKLLTAFGCMDGVKFSESSIDSSEELFIGFKAQNQGYYGLLDYSKVLKSKIETSLITNVPIGWCSWYYYYTDITENDMLKNLNFFKNNTDFPIDFFQLDDGYFTKIGDYLNLNEKFPNGLEYLFTQIKKSGLKAGIWSAPFFAVRNSNLFKTHRKWFLTKNNKLLKVHFNWNSFQYALDLSKSEVLTYILNFFNNLHRIDEKLTMDFFKIDFLHAAVPYGADYSNKSLTRAQILHQGIKKIREAISHQSFLLGCGAPLGPCIGLVDAMRISEDTAPIWDAGFYEKYSNNKGIEHVALKCALINILYRSFMHKYFWINDPDCLMIRRKNTKLSLAEIRLQMTVFGISGGQILISDDMTILSKDEINDAKLLIPPYNPIGFDAVVIDAFKSPIPSIYMLETNEVIGHRFLVAIINWKDQKDTKKVKIYDLIGKYIDKNKKYYVFSFWDKNFIGKFELDDIIEIQDIYAHSCSYLSIIPIDNNSEKDIILVSSDFHISQGCNEITSFEFQKNNNKILLNLRVVGKQKGSIYLKIPINKKVIAYDNTSLVIDEHENIWKFDVDIENNKVIEIYLS